MSMEEEIKELFMHPFMLFNDDDRIKLYDRIIERFELHEGCTILTASIFYNLGYIHGMHAEEEESEKE